MRSGCKILHKKLDFYQEHWIKCLNNTRKYNNLTNYDIKEWL